jgi:hypothetical protein
MSQSDYLQRKKMGTLLVPGNQSKMQKTLDSTDYTLFKQYSLENTIVNTSNTYNQMTRPNTSTIFGMEVSMSDQCPAFETCRNTQDRANRSITDPVAFNPHISVRRPYVNSYTDTYSTNQFVVPKRTVNLHQVVNVCSASKAVLLMEQKDQKNKSQHNTNFTGNRRARLTQHTCST